MMISIISLDYHHKNHSLPYTFLYLRSLEIALNTFDLGYQRKRTLEVILESSSVEM